MFKDVDKPLLYVTLTLFVPYRIWKKIAFPAMLGSFVLLALLFIPDLSYSFGGANRWLKVGPISFQPSEILKLAFVAYLASWLDSRRQEIISVSYGMIPFAIMLAIVGMFLVMQPDIGTLGTAVITSGILYFLGYGKSLQKYNYLPEPMGDSVFAIFAEEMGFLGILLLLGLFVFFLWRGFTIAKHAPDIFGKLLAAGITVGIISQAFINMAAISGLLPLTGIPLPFISYGGTSLAMTLASIGILLNISKHT